jgi:hypothetical protein
MLLALKHQFAEIDAWDMEFEDVSVESNDPMMR